MWADTLTTEEVDASLDAARALESVGWAAPLLSRTKPILDRLRAGQKDKAAYGANPLQPSEISFLFEIRFAHAMASAGLTAEYEHSAGAGNSTIDFRVGLNPPWLIELVSLRESKGFKSAVFGSETAQGFLLSTGADDPWQSEEGETLKAQGRIGEKAFDEKKGPIKFPEPAGSIHMIMVDARGFGGAGLGDEADWAQIALGPNAVEPELVKVWKNTKTGKFEPIKGIFQPDCPIRAAPTVQRRVHFIGFVCESSFTAREIAEKSFYCCNPALFPDEQTARQIMSSWPLKRHAN
jgi:hypothetical protein